MITGTHWSKATVVQKSVRGVPSGTSPSERNIQHLMIGVSPLLIKASIFFVSVNETESCEFDKDNRTSIISTCPTFIG